MLANAGIDVWLLDLPSDGENVNALAERGLQRLRNESSPGLMSKDYEQYIHVGNTRDDFEQLADFSDTSRSEREAAMRAAQQRYVERLNHFCRLAPYNWFNFFDFWEKK